MILKDAIKLIEKQLNINNGTKKINKYGTHHYGKMELIELLSKIYGVPKKDIKINKG